MESIILKRVGYRIEGISKCVMWGGGIGYMNMEPFDIKENSKEEISKGINDNGFGVQSIEGAVVEVFELFEHNFTMHLCEDTVGNITDADYQAIMDMMNI